MKQNIDKYLKISCIIYMILIIIGIFLPDAYVTGIQDLTERPNAFLMIVKWFNYVSVLAFPIAVFYKRPTFKKICVYFCSVIGIIFLLLYSEVIKGYTSELGTGICDIRYLPPFVESFMKNVIFRTIFFFSTILIELVTVGLIIYEDLKNEKTIFRFKKSDVVNLVIILPLLIMSILPPYALEGIFFTYTNVIFKAFTIPHFIWLICIVAEIVICVIIFRKKTKEDAIILVTILALSLFVQFNLLFSTLGELTCKRLPLQLCNIASYLTIISIVFNKRKLFLFNALVNIPGALIAVFVMDVEGKGILYWSNIHYIVEHHNVIVVPLLCLLLGVFEPLITGRQELKIHCEEDFREWRRDARGFESFEEMCRRCWTEFDFKAPDSESLREVQERNIGALEKILERFQGKTVIIGTHGMALSTVLNYYDANFGYEDFKRLLPLMPLIVKLTFDGKRCLTIEQISFSS